MEIYTVGEIMETILAREIRKAVDDELIDSIKDDRKANLEPMIFNSKEDKEKYRNNFEEVINRDI